MHACLHFNAHAAALMLPTTTSFIGLGAISISTTQPIGERARMHACGGAINRACAQQRRWRLPDASWHPPIPHTHTHTQCPIGRRGSPDLYTFLKSVGALPADYDPSTGTAFLNGAIGSTYIQGSWSQERMWRMGSLTADLVNAATPLLPPQANFGWGRRVCAAGSAQADACKSMRGWCTAQWHACRWTALASPIGEPAGKLMGRRLTR